MARTVNNLVSLDSIEVISLTKKEVVSNNRRNHVVFPRPKEVKYYDSQEFTDSVNHCLDLLKKNKFITNINNDVISRRSALLGQEMYEHIKKFYQDNTTQTQNKMTQYEDQSVEEQKENVQKDDNISELNPVRSIKQEPLDIVDELQCRMDDDRLELLRSPRNRNKVCYKEEDDDIDDIKSENNNIVGCKSRKKYTFIPIEVKKRIVQLAKDNPTWSLDFLQKECRSVKLHSMTQIKLWEKQIKSGRTIQDKLNLVYTDTFDKYQIALASKEIITTEKIMEWASFFSIKHGLDIKKKRFEISAQWISKFTSNYNINLSDTFM